MVAASRFIRDILLNNGFYSDRIDVIPLFTYVPKLEALEGSRDINLVIAPGRIVPEKGFQYLIRAFQKVDRKAQLLIVGDGPFLDELKTLATRLGQSERIFFPGWLAKDHLADLYRKCSIVVLPSVAPETFGMVGIEAMAHGKPVVAFDVGGISEWLKNGETGFLVPPRDIAKLGEVITFLLDRPDLAQEMGMKGRKYVSERFLAHHHVDRLISVFERAIEHFSNRSSALPRKRFS